MNTNNELIADKAARLAAYLDAANLPAEVKAAFLAVMEKADDSEISRLYDAFEMRIAEEAVSGADLDFGEKASRILGEYRREEKEIKNYYGGRLEDLLNAAEEASQMIGYAGSKLEDFKDEADKLEAERDERMKSVIKTIEEDSIKRIKESLEDK